MRVAISCRLLAGVLALAWAVLPAALGAHSAEERHGYCDEHERIEHSVAGEVGTGAAKAVAVSPASKGLFADGTTGSPAHDWCPLAEALAGHAAPNPEPPTVATVLPAAAPAPAHAPETDGAVVLVLLIAPKNSPPSLRV